MNGIEIKSGPVRVVASGTVISFEGNPIEIIFGPPRDRLSIIFSFKNDHKEAASENIPRMESLSITEKKVELILFNFNSIIGSGTIKPIQMGTIDNKSLYIQFYISSFSESNNKLFHYTIYQNEVPYQNSLLNERQINGRFEAPSN